MLAVAGASLAVHTLLVLLVVGYRELIFDVGRLFVHSNQFEDMADIIGVGFGVASILAIGLGAILDYLVRRFW